MTEQNLKMRKHRTTIHLSEEDIFLSIRDDEVWAASVAVVDEIFLEPSMRANLVEEDATAAPLSTAALLYSC